MFLFHQHRRTGGDVVKCSHRVSRLVKHLSVTSRVV